ncbi:DUF4838 domain-containing protein [Verrucomicrobiota bacterium]
MSLKALRNLCLSILCISVLSGDLLADKSASNTPQAILKESNSSATKLVVVENGKCNMPIVVSKDAQLYTKKAADELADYIEKMTGVKPDVIVGEPEETPEHAIWVGVQPKVKEVFPNVDLDFKFPEEIVVAVNDNHILIAGRDIWTEEGLVVEQKVFGKMDTFDGIQAEYGTVNAVYTFIQDFLGVRWLWPGDLGEDVLKKEKIAFAPFEYRYHPKLGYRSGLLLMSQVYRSHRKTDICNWSLRQRLLLDSYIQVKSPFSKYWVRFHKTHPEYFALQPDGTRSGWPGPFDGKINRIGRTVKLCLSNPAVWQEWLRDVEQALKQNPNATVFDCFTNDGVPMGHCICDNCLAWDNPKGDPVWFSWVGLGLEYVALSDRTVTFANHLARLLKEKYPDKDYYVEFLSYGFTKPVPIEAVPDDNVIIRGSWCFWNQPPESEWINPRRTWRLTAREQFDGWSNKAKNTIWYPSPPWVGFREGHPVVLMSKTIKDLKYAAEKGMIGFSIEAIHDHWATQGPLYYLMGQLVWDPSKDGEAVLNDYYERGFAEGAKDINNYWDYLEESTIHVFKKLGSKWGVYDEAFFTKAHSFLDAADKKLSGKPEIYSKRVNFFRAGLNCHKLVVDNHNLMERYFDSKKTDEKIANKVRENWKVIEKIAKENPHSVAWVYIRPNTKNNLHPDNISENKRAFLRRKADKRRRMNELRKNSEKDDGMQVEYGAAALYTFKDFRWKYKENAAQGLFDKKKYKEAEDAFDALIPTAGTKEDKTMTFSKSVIALGCQKDQFDAAMKKAQAIDDKVLSTYAQFRIMDFNRKYKELTEKYKDEDISVWPESIKPEGYSMRAGAYSVIEDYEAALLDYRKAIETSGLSYSEKTRSFRSAYLRDIVKTRADTFNTIAVFQLKLNKKDLAVETYEEALAFYENNEKIIGLATYCQTVTGYAEILKQDEKYEKAIEVLTRHKAKNIHVAPTVFELTGDIYVLMGEKDKAIEKYKEAIEMKKLAKKKYEAIDKKIEELQKK